MMGYIFAEQLLYWIETLGILAFALSGVILARQKDFDIVGVYIIAWVTAFGGGTIRDVVLDIQPVYWIAHAEYPLMLLGLIIVISLLKKIQIKSSWLLVPDAMGMALFAISTAQTAHQLGHPPIIVAILATIVASFGGVIRDSLCQDIPMIFQKGSTLYASLAFLGAYLYVGLVQAAIFSPVVTMAVSVSVIFIVRLLAIKFHWRWRA